MNLDHKEKFLIGSNDDDKDKDTEKKEKSDDEDTEKKYVRRTEEKIFWFNEITKKI